MEEICEVCGKETNDKVKHKGKLYYLCSEKSEIKFNNKALYSRVKQGRDGNRANKIKEAIKRKKEIIKEVFSYGDTQNPTFG